MKVKNVIRGLQREYELQEINIISQAESKVYYSGSVDGWKATDVDLILLKRKIENSEVVDRIMFNNKKALYSSRRLTHFTQQNKSPGHYSQ